MAPIQARKGVIFFWTLFIACALFRVWQSLHIVPSDARDCLGKNVSGAGIVSDEPETKDTGQILVVATEKMFAQMPNASPRSKAQIFNTVPCGGEINVRLKTKLYPRFAYGDRISFIGKISLPMDFQSGDGRSFDFQGYLAKDDIFYEIKSATVKSQDDSTIISDSSSLQAPLPHSDLATVFEYLCSVPDRVNEVLFHLKRSFVENLNRTLGEPQSALAAGLVVGEKAALGNDLLNDFRTVGLIHIVVLSGYNITVVADAMRRLLSFLPRVWGIVVGGIGIALFGILVGGGATVIRSCFMAGIALSADLLRRQYNVTRALLFAGLIMLIQNPMILLHDPSFQLSFLATLGLILLASPIEKRLKFIPAKFGMRGIVASTLATQIFVSPYILYMMGQLSVIGMVVNILVLPFIPVTMLFVFLTGALGMVSYIVSQCVGYGVHLLLSYELFMVTHFARLPFAAVHVGAFSFWWVVGFYGVFGAMFILLKNTQKNNKTNIQ